MSKKTPKPSTRTEQLGLVNMEKNRNSSIIYVEPVQRPHPNNMKTNPIYQKTTETPIIPSLDAALV